MGWKAFVGSVIGSLAWPGVVAILLIILRRQIVGLAERLHEISLPGGAKATFAKELETARIIEAHSEQSLPQITQDSELQEVRSRVVPETSESKYLRLVMASPEAAIIDAYKDIEELVMDKIAPLLGVHANNPSVIVNELVRRELTDSATLNLFGVLRSARNVAAHQRTGISVDEALDYWDHIQNLASKLNFALGRLEVLARQKEK